MRLVQEEEDNIKRSAQGNYSLISSNPRTISKHPFFTPHKMATIEKQVFLEQSPKSLVKRN